MTIIELSFTIAVLGIVMVLGVRGGETLVESAEAFMVGRDLQQIQNSVVFYEARYKQFPGNDREAGRRWNMPDPISNVRGMEVSFAGEGRIHGLLTDPLDPNGEQYMAWRHLRAAGLMDGDPNAAGASAMPENPFGGFYGFDEGNLGQKGGSLCATRIPGRAAQMIDDRLDDGIIDKGLVVATSKYDPTDARNHFSAPDSAPYDVEKEYIICVPIRP